VFHGCGSEILVNAGRGKLRGQAWGQTWSADAGSTGWNTICDDDHESHTNDPRQLYQNGGWGPDHLQRFTVLERDANNVGIEVCGLYWTAVGNGI